MEFNCRRCDNLWPHRFAGRVDVAEALLERGADVNASVTGGPLFGLSALMLASMNGHAALASRLIAAGARVNARAWFGYSAVAFAADKGHVDVVALLRKAGAESVWRARLRFGVRMVLVSPLLLVLAASVWPSPRLCSSRKTSVADGVCVRVRLACGLQALSLVFAPVVVPVAVLVARLIK